MRDFSITTILPFLSPCQYLSQLLCCHGSNSTSDQIKQVYKKIVSSLSDRGTPGLKDPLNLRKEKVVLGKEEDPYNQLFIRYGLGINSFFQMISKLLNIYMKISIIAITQMTIMYKNNSENEDLGFFGKTSIAGFAYSRPLCKILPASLSDMHVNCDKGDVI